MRLPSLPAISRTILLSTAGLLVVAIIAVWLLVQMPSAEKEQLALYLPADQTTLLLTTSNRGMLLQWLRNAQGLFTQQALLPESSLEQAARYDLAILRGESGSLAGWAVETRTEDAKTGKTVYKIITSDGRISQLLKQTREQKRGRLVDAPIMRAALTDPTVRLFLDLRALPTQSNSDGARLLAALLSPYRTAVIETDDQNGSIRLERKTGDSGPSLALLDASSLGLSLPSPAFAIALGDPQHTIAAIIDRVHSVDAPLADGIAGIFRQQWMERFPLTTASGAFALLTKSTTLEMSASGTFLLRGEAVKAPDAAQALQSLLASGAQPYTIRKQQFSAQHSRTDIVINNGNGQTLRDNGWDIAIAAGSGAAIATHDQRFLFSNSGAAIIDAIRNDPSLHPLPDALNQRGMIAAGIVDPAFISQTLQPTMPFLLPPPDWFALIQTTLLPTQRFQWSWGEIRTETTIEWKTVSH